MSLRFQIEKNKIKSILLHEENYEFPELVKELRTASGLSRREVADAIGVPASMIFTLEHGTFKIFPKKQKLDSIGHYFGVSPKLLKDKAESYVFDNNLPVKKLDKLRRICP